MQLAEKIHFLQSSHFLSPLVSKIVKKIKISKNDPDSQAIVVSQLYMHHVSRILTVLNEIQVTDWADQEWHSDYQRAQFLADCIFFHSLDRAREFQRIVWKLYRYDPQRSLDYPKILIEEMTYFSQLMNQFLQKWNLLLISDMKPQWNDEIQQNWMVLKDSFKKEFVFSLYNMTQHHELLGALLLSSHPDLSTEDIMSLLIQDLVSGFYVKDIQEMLNAQIVQKQYVFGKDVMMSCFHDFVTVHHRIDQEWTCYRNFYRKKAIGMMYSAQNDLISLLKIDTIPPEKLVADPVVFQNIEKLSENIVSHDYEALLQKHKELIELQKDSYENFLQLNQMLLKKWKELVVTLYPVAIFYGGQRKEYGHQLANWKELSAFYDVSPILTTCALARMIVSGYIHGLTQYEKQSAVMRNLSADSMIFAIAQDVSQQHRFSPEIEMISEAIGESVETIIKTLEKIFLKSSLKQVFFQQIRVSIDHASEKSLPSLDEQTVALFDQSLKALRALLMQWSFTLISPFTNAVKEFISTYWGQCLSYRRNIMKYWTQDYFASPLDFGLDQPGQNMLISRFGELKFEESIPYFDSTRAMIDSSLRNAVLIFLRHQTDVNTALSQGSHNRCIVK